jgi:hypothetical protein
MENAIVNKVAMSGIITIDPADFFPDKNMVVFDLKNFLFKEMILKEKEFRQSLKTLNTEPYENKIVVVTCSNDAIIPQWAYMLVTSRLLSVTSDIYVGTEASVKEMLTLSNIEKADITPYQQTRIVLKGCGDISVPSSAYAALTKRLQPIAKSVMYGEPCSSVPVYKQKAT